jgi:predicted AlkP superfamily pyrophosphatase or phosphodiesterase
MKNTKNPELSVGDRIILYHMEGETGVDPGTHGTVSNVTRDPFEDDNQLVMVDWDNGSKLSILSKYDVWKFAKKKQIDESAEDWLKDNGELLKYFKHRDVRDFLMKVRESGITNMFAASPLLYAGREHIDRYYGENPPDEEAFEQVLDMADDVRNMMIRGTMKYLEAKRKEVSIDNVNSNIRKLSNKMWEFYGNFI